MRSAQTLTTTAASVTRPANTTAYSAGQVMGATAASVLKFPRCTRQPGYGGSIIGATILDGANQGTKPTVELWLFNTSPTAVADAGAFAPSSADLAGFVGIIPFSSSYVANAGSGAAGSQIQLASAPAIPFRTLPADSALYGLLVVRNAYAPVSAEQITVTLTISQD